jgi:fructose-bisphosphate aldolase class II
VVRGIRCGCSGIMLDASSLPLDENIKMTQRIGNLCGDTGIPIEGELGRIGSVKDEALNDFTDVKEVIKFVEQTKVAALAISVGTAHGMAD